MIVYPQYTVVAEKVSAMIARGMDNSRLKDYFDIWALTETFPFDLALLATAMSRTLGRKGFSLPGEWPDGLTDDYAANAMKLSQWNAFLRKTQALNASGFPLRRRGPHPRLPFPRRVG